MRSVALLLAAGCGAAAAPAPGPLAVWRSAPDVQLEKHFQNFDGLWRGGDAVYSVPLAPDRILWLFGDSFVAPPGKAGRHDSRMPRNTLAIQTAGNPPLFYWRTADGHPSDAIPSSNPAHWLWPLGGIRVGPTLHLFFMEQKRAEKALPFALVGNLLLTIPNPDDPPAQWQIRQSPVPFARIAGPGDRLFGTSVLHQDGQFFIYGTREDPRKQIGSHSLLVARAPRLDDYSTWKFLDSSGSWVGDVDKAGDLFGETATEMSVTFLPGTKEFAAVYTRAGLLPEILVRRAPRPEGPWGPPAILFRAPEPEWSRSYYAYAAKAHPELARGPNELVVSYAANSLHFRDLFSDLRLYWPRFIRATLH